jgi:hypothetical protein
MGLLEIQKKDERIILRQILRAIFPDCVGRVNITGV